MDDSSFPPDKPSLFERFAALLTPEPEDRDELLAFLRAAHGRDLFDADAFSIIEGALQMSDMRACDIMVARARMNVIHIDDSVNAIVAFAVKTGHSRFPVIEGDKDDVMGILLAKDLLRFFAGQEFCLREMLRPAMFIPESKPLNVLLHEFRLSHNHMAVVVDEYGGVAGLVTIEDVLEQIVGDIEDEYDTETADEGGGDIIAEYGGRFRVRAMIPIGDFNEAFSTAFSDEEIETLGGLLICHFGRLPRRGEMAVIEGWRFRVLRADSRRIYTLLVERMPDAPFVGSGVSGA
ncbi:MAG: CBS domain-containing protein [Betaproteobacteria bacterium]|jgi:magnesium and cobalt transporter|nr:CBS domain-containing protein [Betaproteobacteria bacterium]